MKKIICTIISLLLLGTLFAGCAKKEKKDELSIKICGYSDSITGTAHKLEYRGWSKGTFIDAKADKTVTVSVGGTEVTGHYRESERRRPEFYDTHEYVDEENHTFSLTDDGKLSLYFWGNNPSKEDDQQTLTESECIAIASAFVADITDISEYTVTSTYDENQKMYTVSFAKYADGFLCADEAEVRVDETGYIYSFSSFMLGRMSPDATTDFDREAIQEEIISKLDVEYSDAKQTYDKVTYENFNYTLTLDENGDYALTCAVDVNCIDFYDQYEAVQSERIILLIQ